MDLSYSVERTLINSVYYISEGLSVLTFSLMVDAVSAEQLVGDRELPLSQSL